MMRTRFTSFIACIAVLTAPVGIAAAQSTPANRSADAAAIRAHIESICQAFVDKDAKKLEQTHGKDWRGFTPWSGHVIRGLDGYMNEATFEPGTPKGQGMVGYRMSDFDVVFYGDVGVASFVLDLDVVYGGEKNTQKLTLVDVYHKGPQGWIQVASNTSLHPDELERQASRFHRLSAADTFGTRASNLDGSRGFAASGGRLARLVFPRTELQAYGNTVIVYTTYEMDLVTGGKTSTERGVATEIFVRQDGQWLNTGWQLAPVGK